MIKKICIIISTPLEKRDYERFGIDILKKRDFVIFVLDLTGLLFSDYLKKYNPPDVVNYENVIKIRKLYELEIFLKRNKDMLYIDFVRISFNTFKLFKLLKKYNIQYVSFYANCIPFSSSNYKNNFINKFFNKFKELNRVNFLSKLRSFYILARLNETQSPLMVLLGGERSKYFLKSNEKKAEKVWIHSLDYDLYLKSKEKKQETKKYIVFLDEYHPFHPDLILLGISIPFIDPKKYYDILNKLFDYLENKTKLKVIIAGHPRSRYDKHPDYFYGREVIKYKTIDLVRDSDLVVAHSSTSINFVVLFKKPLIICTTDELKKSIFGELISNFAYQLNKKVYNIDEEINFNVTHEMKVDVHIYNEYIKNYIKMPGTPNRLFWDIASDVFEKVVLLTE